MIKRMDHLLSRRPCPSLLQTNATVVSPSSPMIKPTENPLSRRPRPCPSLLQTNATQVFPSSQPPMINRPDHLYSRQHCRPSLLQTNTTRVSPSSQDLPPLVILTGTPLLSSSLIPLKTPTRKTRLNNLSGKFMTRSAIGRKPLSNFPMVQVEKLSLTSLPRTSKNTWTRLGKVKRLSIRHSLCQCYCHRRPQPLPGQSRTLRT